MRKLINLAAVGLLIAIAISSTGCASYLSYQSSKDEVLRNRVYASGNPEAVRMVKMGADPESAIRAIPLGRDGAAGVGIGVDITSLDTLSQHPWRQLGAALLDAVTIWAAGEGYRQIADKEGTDSGNNNVHVNVNNTGGTTEVNINGTGNGGTGTSGSNRDNSSEE